MKIFNFIIDAIFLFVSLAVLIDTFGVFSLSIEVRAVFIGIMAAFAILYSAMEIRKDIKEDYGGKK